MKPSIQARLEQIAARQEEVAALLSDSEVIADQNQFRTLSQEYAQMDTQTDAPTDASRDADLQAYSSRPSGSLRPSTGRPALILSVVRRLMNCTSRAIYLLRLPGWRGLPHFFYQVPRCSQSQLA